MGSKRKIQKAKTKIQKAKTKKTATSVRAGGGLVSKIKIVERLVNDKLGQYKDSTLLIQTQEELHEYIDKCIENGVISIDTETT